MSAISSVFKVGFNFEFDDAWISDLANEDQVDSLSSSPAQSPVKIELRHPDDPEDEMKLEVQAAPWVAVISPEAMT